MMTRDDMLEAGLAAVRRRALLRRAGVGFASTAALAALASTSFGVGGAQAASTTVPATSAPTQQDINIFNFALNLEYLDSTYYHLASLGTDLNAADITSTDGSTTQGTLLATGATAVSFQTSIIGQFADTFAADEQANVQFIRSLLASNNAPAVARPTLDLSVGPASAFSTLAVKAGIIAAGQTFNPYADENAFLLGAYVFEDVAVTAYAGSAALISQGSALVQYAAGLQGTEAYHAATIRTLLAIRGGGNATDGISNVRSMASSGVQYPQTGYDDVGTLDPLTGNVVLGPFDPVNGATVFRRSTQQVLNIVYGNAGATRTPGLFFPNGLNALAGAAALGFA